MTQHLNPNSVHAATPTSALDKLEELPRWMPWREEDRDGRPTKVPYNPHTGRGGSSTEPASWGTRAEAQKFLKRLLKGGRKGGVGIALGDMGDGTTLGGLDLDGCQFLDVREPWANEALRELGTYAETSPSGEGVKAFFRIHTADRLAAGTALGLRDGTNGGTLWKAGPHDGAEAYLGGRWFAVTDAGDPKPIALVDAERLAAVRAVVDRQAGRARTVEHAPNGERDESGSGHGYRFMCAQAKSHRDRGRALSAIDADEGPAGEWARRTDPRQIMRAWDSACREMPPPVNAEEAFEEEPKEETPEAGIVFLTPDQCATSPARDYVVKGLIAPEDLGCIFGEPGAGKSLISPLIGYRVAQGERAFNLRTRMGGVFYVAAEDPTGMKGRIRALRQKYGDAPDFRLVPGIGRLFDFAAGKESPALHSLRKEVAKQRPALIVIDTLAMAFPGLDENDAKSMAVVVMVGRELAKHGAAVLFVHHTPKGGDTPRGHSVFNGALDVSLLVEKGEAKGIVRGRLPKNRNGSPDHDIAFSIGVADFGEDDDGDRITAAYALELEGGDGRRREKLSKTEDAAHTVLVRLSTESEWVSEGVWREAMMADAAVSASDKPDSRRKAAARSIEGLCRKGAVEQQGDRFRVAKSGRDFSDAFQDGDDDASY